MQKFIDGRYNRPEHLMADVIDTLDQIAYYTSVGAMSQIDHKAMKKVHDGRPKMRKRPGPEAEKPVKKVFTKGKDAKAVLNQWTKRTTIDHIPGCKATDGTCGCPRRLVDK